MARVKAIHRSDDYPGMPDEMTRQELVALFQHLFPGNPHPEIDQSHAGLAVAAHNPKLALNLAKLSALIAGELPWSQRRDLRELAIQAVNVHFGSDYSFQARMGAAQAAGISADQLAAIAHWRTSPLFNEEQGLVLEYAHAVASGQVPGALFGRVVERYGEKGAVELTSLIAFWSFWALFLNATRPDED